MAQEVVSYIIRAMMDPQRITSMIDEEITRLTQVRDLLRGSTKNARATTNHKPKKRKYNAAFRAKMRRAMRKRWREARKNGQATLSK